MKKNSIISSAARQVEMKISSSHELLQELKRRNGICKTCQHQLCRGTSTFRCYAHTTQEELDAIQVIIDARSYDQASRLSK